MMKKWLRLLLFIPLIALLVCVNFFLDYVGSFHDVNKEIAISIVNGNNTAFGSLNEREVKHQIIKNMPDEVDCVAIGSSLVMCVNNDLVKSDTFFNLGASSSDMFDFLAQFGLMEIHDKRVNKVIFCLDSQSFDKTLYDTHTANKELMVYADYMIDILNNEDDIIEPKDEEVARINFKNLFSISNFQKNIERYKLTRNVDRVFSVDENYDGGFYGYDASWNYILDTRNNTEKDVLEDVEKYDMERHFTPGEHMDEFATDIFIKLIRYLKNKDVEVELFLCPLPPALWGKYDNNESPILSELSSFANELALEYGLKLIGSYNPYDLGISNAEFYDARHVRRECLNKYFDFAN